MSRSQPYISGKYGIKIQNGGERLGKWSSREDYNNMIGFVEEVFFPGCGEEEEEEEEVLFFPGCGEEQEEVLFFHGWGEEEEQEEVLFFPGWGEEEEIIFPWLWGERDDKKKPSEKSPPISPPRLGSYTNSSSSRPALQPNLINFRSDDAWDWYIPPKLKIQALGDGKQVSARPQQYNRVEQKEERTRGVVGKNWWDCSSCEEKDLEEGKLNRGVWVKERWIKHYTSEYKILLVGEGDFSFSASLAVAFASASNITATSLDSIEFLSTNYRHALSNIDKLRSLGAKVMHDVDATKMAKIFPFKCMRFDQVVYNFPHAGFFPDESREDQIRRHQMLVQLFLENAKKIIHINGEIHIAHKSHGFFLEWNLELLASNVGLGLIEEVPFNFRDYPGYRTKYGFGGDNNFNCNPSKTYKFGHTKTD